MTQEQRVISFLHHLSLQGIDFRDMTKIAQEIGPGSDVTQQFYDFSRHMPIHTCQEIWPSPLKWQLQDVYVFMMRFILSSTFCGVFLASFREIDIYRWVIDMSCAITESPENHQPFLHSSKGKRSHIFRFKMLLVYLRSYPLHPFSPLINIFG